MAAQMTRRERLTATFAGQPVDRVAAALWRHFPGDDQRPADLATSTLAFQAQYDWDFIKVSPASSFCLVDWGAKDAWVGGDEGSREYTYHPVEVPDDWATLPVLDPKTGFLSGQLRCLELIHDGVGDQVPFIQTIFAPLSQAKSLSGMDRLIVHLREEPKAVHAGLETITQSTIRFIQACLSRGVAGIYYAVQLASYGLLSEAEYREFGEPYDRRVLQAAGECWFNLLHLHGMDVMFDLCAAYPVPAINWHSRETPPSLGEGLERFGGAVCGGLAQWDDILKGDPDSIRLEISDAIRQTGGKRLIMASGCVAPSNSPWSNLRAVRATVEDTRKESPVRTA
jgi:uroporphyrinogen decarboxylase